MFSDFRYALRQFAKNPGFTAVAVFTLALGIGGNTAIFSVLNTLLLRALPGIKEPKRLVIATRNGERVPPDSQTAFSYPFYERIRDGAKSLAETAASSAKNSGRSLIAAGFGSDQVEPVQANFVSGNYFSFLGVQAVLGRTLGPADDLPGSARPVVVLSHRYWENRFGSDPAVIGKVLVIDAVSCSIIGVGQPGFSGVQLGSNPDVWVPLQLLAQLDPLDLGARLRNPLAAAWVNVMGRLAPGVDRRSAQAEAGLLYRQSQNELVASIGSHWSPAARGQFLDDHFELQPGGSGYSGFQYFKPAISIVTTITGLVFLGACANVTGLLLTRGASRERELAVRLALGSGRRRLITQLLAESSLLGLAGGLLGLVFSRWGTHVLIGYLPEFFLNVDLRPDLHVLLFLAAASLFAGVLIGLISALRFSRLDLITVLKNQTHGVTGSRQRANRILVIGQLAVTVCLVAGAGLFVRTLGMLQDVNPGFEVRQMLMLVLSFDKNYDANHRRDLFLRALAELKALPGVSQASFGLGGMVSGGNSTITGFVPEGAASASGGQPGSYLTSVGPGFFETLAIPLRRGRALVGADLVAKSPLAGPNAPIPIVINETLARRYFSQTDPLGRHLRIGGPLAPATYEIVGVAQDVKYHDLRENPSPEIYVPYGSALVRAGPSMVFQIRTAGSPLALAANLTSAMQRVDPTARVAVMRTFDELLDHVLLQERVLAQVAGFFSGLAVILSCVGLYGVLAYQVSQRTREIGVRMALGANARSILGLILRQGIALCLTGCGAGMIATFVLSRFVANRLYGVSRTDPVTFIGTAALLVAVALLASWLPARRATEVDPVVALRAE